jgi:D-proline reductase (dithiol) PrdB
MFHRWARNYTFVEPDHIPWTSFEAPMARRRIALVTTAGVHLKSDPPFNMTDPAGDPDFREIPYDVDLRDLTITHNYYDHGDADRDVNIVLPLERVRELAAFGEIGSVNHRHFSFMGHVLDRHLDTLIHQTSLQVAQKLKDDRVDVAILTPA